MSEIQVWDSLPLIVKLRWYADAFGYLMGVACLVILIVLLIYVKLDEWWRAKKS